MEHCRSRTQTVLQKVRMCPQLPTFLGHCHFEVTGASSIVATNIVIMQIVQHYVQYAAPLNIQLNISRPMSTARANYFTAKK